MSSSSRRQLEDWLKDIKVPIGADVLDIGGSQKPVRNRLGAHGEATRYVIFDLENPHEKTFSPDITGDIQNIDTFSENAEKYVEFFDIAFCLEVAEYWTRPHEALKNIANFLKPGGLLYISFQFVYPAHNPVKQDSLRYTFAGAEKLLEEAGFEISDYVDRFGESMSPVMVYSAEGMKMAEGANHDATGWLIKCRKI